MWQVELLWVLKREEEVPLSESFLFHFSTLLLHSQILLYMYAYVWFFPKIRHVCDIHVKQYKNTNETFVTSSPIWSNQPIIFLITYHSTIVGLVLYTRMGSTYLSYPLVKTNNVTNKACMHAHRCMPSKSIIKQKDSGDIRSSMTSREEQLLYSFIWQRFVVLSTFTGVWDISVHKTASILKEFTV